MFLKKEGSWHSAMHFNLHLFNSSWIWQVGMFAGEESKSINANSTFLIAKWSLWLSWKSVFVMISVRQLGQLPTLWAWRKKKKEDNCHWVLWTLQQHCTLVDIILCCKRLQSQATRSLWVCLRAQIYKSDQWTYDLWLHKCQALPDDSNLIIMLYLLIPSSVTLTIIV